MTITNTLGLTDLNTANPSNLADALRNIKGPNVGLGDLLNQIIVQGNTYSTAVAAAQTATYGGVATAGDVLKLTIGGTLFSHTVVNATSVTAAMTEMALALNANTTFSGLYAASNAAGVLTVAAKRKGPAADTTTFVAAVTGTGTFVAGGATLTGGSGVDDVLTIVA